MKAGRDPEWVGKRRFSVALIVLVGVTALCPEHTSAALKAGASKRDVSVPELLGNQPVHDPLLARVLVLDDGDKAVAIICLDMIAPWFAEVRERIQTQLGITRVLVNCSHTHSNGRGVGSSAEWRARVGQLIYEAAEEAYEYRVPASLHTGRAPVQIGHNRYGDAFTQEIVPWVNVLEVRTADDKTLAVLFEHPAHPVIAMPHSGLSADFPGYAVKRINEALGDEVIPMFAQGCGGNINGDHVAGGHESAARTGRKLGNAVLTALTATTKVRADKLVLCSKTIMLPMHLPTMERWEKMIQRIKVGGEVPPREGWPNDGATMKTMEILKGMMERGKPPKMPMEINAVMLGSEWCLVTMAGEVFTEYEMWVNSLAPFDHNMVFGFTNAVVGARDDEYIGYVPTDRALALGIKTPIVAETACMEAGSFPGFFHGVRVDGAYTSYAIGIEGLIKKAITSFWTK